MRGAIVILGFVAALAACSPQKKSEEDVAGPVAAGGSSAQAVAGPAAEVNIDDGAVITGGGQPAFAPQYPGGAVVTSMTAAENGKHGGVYAFTTADPVERVFTFYRGKAEAGGLASETNVETGGARVYSAKGAAGDVAVTAAPQGEGRTYVQVTWSAKS